MRHPIPRIRIRSATVPLLLLALAARGPGAFAQELPAHMQRQAEVTGKRLLDHDVYDSWRALRNRDLSPDGRWITFRYVPGDGDAELVIRRTDSDQVHTVERGGPATLTGEWDYAVFVISPAHIAVRQAKRDSVKNEDMPKDTLAILRVGEAPEQALRIPEVSAFEVPAEEGNLVAYVVEPEEEEEGGEAEAAEETPSEPEAQEPQEQEEPEKPDRGEGKTLVLRDLDSGQEWRFENVKAYAFTPRGEALAFTRVTEDGAGDGAYVVDTRSGQVRALHEGMGRYTRLTTGEEGTRVAFLTDQPDWEGEDPEFTLMLADASGGGGARAVASTGTPGVPPDWIVSENGNLEFSRSGRRLYFGTAPRPMEEVEDTLLDEDRVEVDVWNWKDAYLQPMQLVQREEELERTYRAVLHLDAGDRVVQLADETVPSVSLADEGEGDYAVAFTDIPYRQLLSWDGRYNDVYVVDIRTGERRMVRKRLRGFSPGQPSPAGRYLTWWDEETTSWMAVATAGGDPVNLSENVPYPTWDVLDDHPQGLPPESFPVWTEGDQEVLIADQYDLWVVNPDNGEARSLTEGMGRREGLRFRYARVDSEERAVPRDGDIHLSAFHLTTKASGIYRDRVQGDREPRRVVYGDRAYNTPEKAKDADRFIVSWSTFRDYPEYRATGPSLQDGRLLTNTNPQQGEYSWGTAELVDWVSTDGIPLQGILYKPEGFDPTVKYPMMVYFYERMSDGLHRHITPAPGSSSINFAFYVSRGYLLFIPDIPYKIGWPGESAENAVVPGVLSLIDEGFVDPAHVGVQGHSWGGYQISYMVTRTNLFAAAEAGAPVANMTSAYGGIRWGSGMSRAFQYERTQSRIGGTLWDAQHRYIENSPLFQADKVETPLLMMHNDEDTAVPWYQGIEYFTALRRLGKPVWMMNYNGEPHGLRQRPNQKDWAMRMQQFFDHYLVDAPSPVWLELGVPAVLKGKTLGLELVEPRRPISQDGQGREPQP